MKYILFPTDFSDVSLNAFTYAAEYAKLANTNIIVFHAYEDDKEVEHKLIDMSEIIELRANQNKFSSFERILEDRNATNVEMSYVVKNGSFITSLKEFIDENNEEIEMVVMGTMNEKRSVLRRLFVEQNAVRVLEQIQKPIIAVPSKANFDGKMDNIMFLLDYRDDEKEPLEALILKAKEYKAKLHVVHFDISHREALMPYMENFKKSLTVKNIEHVTFHSIDTMDIRLSLGEYCRNNEIDIVCLVSRKQNFYQRLFSYGLAEELIENIDIPIMTIYQD